MPVCETRLRPTVGELTPIHKLVLVDDPLSRADLQGVLGRLLQGFRVGPVPRHDGLYGRLPRALRQELRPPFVSLPDQSLDPTSGSTHCVPFTELEKLGVDGVDLLSV